jgi:hypothetical protein
MVRYTFFAMCFLLQVCMVTLPVSAQVICAPWKILSLKGEPQPAATSWCSVATVWNVTDAIYYKRPTAGSPPLQCEIVEERVKTEEMKNGTPTRPDTCCDEAVGKWRFECQMNRWPEVFLDTLGFSYQPPLKLDEDGNKPKGSFVRLAWPMAAGEICNDRPYISIIGASEYQTHAVVTHGFFQQPITIGGKTISNRVILVYDPLTDDAYADDWRYATRNYIVPFGEIHFGDTYSIKRLVNQRGVGSHPK